MNLYILQSTLVILTNEEKKKKIFKFLLDAEIENNIKNDNGYTPIDTLANQRVNPILFSILKGRYDFNNPNSTTNLTSAMTLHSAILSNNYNIIKAHLEVGTDINEISEENNNSYGLSPLGVACYILDFESVELLFKNSANLNLKNIFFFYIFSSGVIAIKITLTINKILATRKFN